MAFKLGGGQVPKREKKTHDQNAFPMPPVVSTGTAQQLELGDTLFQRHCAKCHAGAGGAIPDLRKMDTQTHKTFMDIVIGGIRADKGMGSFKEVLQEGEAESIHAYLIELAWQSYRDANKTPASHQPEMSNQKEKKN